MLNESIKKFRLAVYAGDVNTPLSLSRGLGPLLDMAKQDHRLELVPAPNSGNDLGWAWLNGCDALFMEQPYTNQHVNCVATARLLGLPVWVDWGDDLYHVNPDNPAITVDPAFGDEELMRENIGSIIEMANLVTVVTETLRAVYSTPAHASKFLILPEGCRWPAATQPREKTVSWRGLSSHNGDVASVLDQLCEVAGDPEFADWKWILFGTPSPAMVKRLHATVGKRLAVSPFWPTPWHMMHAWAAERPYLHIYPLPENEFNVCKPPSVWLEASAVGAAVIGPDLPEWRRCAGLVTYAPAFFGERLKAELRKFDAGAFHPGVAKAREQIYPGETIETVNQRRWAIVNKLAQPKLNHRGTESTEVKA